LWSPGKIPPTPWYDVAMVRAFLGLGLCALFSAGCSSGDDDDTTPIEGAPLDCAWLASDNCWKTTVAAAASCLPPVEEHGTFSADGGSCTYASGTTVTFDTEVKLPLPDDASETWDFSLGQGANECLHYSSDASGANTLTVQGMTYSEDVIGVGLQVLCPDGTKYAAQNAFELLNCPNFFKNAPGFSDSSSDLAVNFALLTGTGSTLGVFDCQKP